MYTRIGTCIYIHEVVLHTIVLCLTLHTVGLLGETAPLCWNWYYACQLEAYCAGCDTVGVQGLGWPGRVECGLLSDPEGHCSGGHVSQAL